MSVSSRARVAAATLRTTVKHRVKPYHRLQSTGRVTVGRHSYGTPTVRLYAYDDTTSLRIGNFCSLADSSTFLLGGEHPVDRVSTFPFRIIFELAGAGTDGYPFSRGDIVLEHDVWIGHDVTVLSGAHISTGAVVAANTLVNRFVEPYAIVAGTPARTVGYRFEKADRTKLLASQWWELPDADLIELAPLLASGDLPAFFAALTGKGSSAD